MARRTRIVARHLIVCVGTLVGGAALWPAVGSAQGSGAISLTPPDPYRWEISGDIGWLSSNKSEIGQGWNGWYDVGTGGALLGRYVTPNLKTELRLALSGEGDIYQQEQVEVPGSRFPAFRVREHHFRASTLGAGVTYQFFRNQWFHPHVAAGLEVVRETDRVLAQESRLFFSQTGLPVQLSAAEATTVSWGVRPLAGAGFKWYLNERSFARTDLRVSIGDRRASHVVWTAGIGVDL